MFHIGTHFNSQRKSNHPPTKKQNHTMISVVDAIVVGTGLAGLTVSLHVLDRGGTVILIDKESKMGGNSIKASSGINACVVSSSKLNNYNDDTGTNSIVTQDEIDSFIQDTMISAGDTANPDLIKVIVEQSADCFQWLQARVGLNLSETNSQTRLGGHSKARTHRPSNGTIGYSLISAMHNALKEYEERGDLKILLSTRVTSLLQEGNLGVDSVLPSRITGVRAIQQQRLPPEVDGPHDEDVVELLLIAEHVVLATGGFAADRGASSYLAEYAPQYLDMPATVGDFSTGDGIKVATIVGAGKIGMDKIQLHPTGFVDPTDPMNPSKILCAEVMRGVGGILLNKKGQRFCNELGTRDYVVERMIKQIDSDHPFGRPNKPLSIPHSFIVLSAETGEKAIDHVKFYSWKKLLQKCQGIDQLATFLEVDVVSLKDTLVEYQKCARDGMDS
jgi:flavocytochrome c